MRIQEEQHSTHMFRVCTQRLVSVLIICACPISGVAEDVCADGTLWEPYTMVCAEIRDLREQFLPTDPEPVNSLPPMTEGLQIPGGLSVGTIYSLLPALNSGRLHTRMFVYPDGLRPDGDLPLLYTTATSRVQHGLEVVGIYWREYVNLGRLGLWAWPCFPSFPCPDGDTSPGWQWITGFSNLACNITHGVDQGGHSQKELYYANHTDKLDNGAPPQWKSALYLWNYCDEAWDLAWEHTYREAKVDCSVQGSRCAWWGPGIETFGADPYPQIAELGYEDSLLYHDGTWSELRPPETDFRDPAIWATQTPWQLFHLDPNRSYGVGNFLNQNDPPIIDGQLPLEVVEEESLTVSVSDLLVNDPDVDTDYHASFEISLFGGDNYSQSGAVVTPEKDFNGLLRIPTTVSDGAADSQIFQLQINVTPVNDAPDITGQFELSTLERSPLTIGVRDLIIVDPDNNESELAITVEDGVGYMRAGNTITPEPGIVGDLMVPVTVSDGEFDSTEFILTVTVLPDAIPPVLTLLGSSTVNVTVGSSYRDAGATATDNIDGNLTDRITVDSNVNTSSVGTYAIRYSVSDLAGNETSATRTVNVNAQVARRSGGGSADPILLVLLLLCARRVLVRPDY